MEMPAHMFFALQELGVSEAAGDADNPRVLKYFSATNYNQNQIADTIPWCSAFACFCLEQTGNTSPHSAWSLSFLKWGEVLQSPELGCIAVLSRTSDPSKGHVGFVLGFDEKDLYLLSGNTSNKVTIDRFPRDKVLGFRKPKVKQTSNPGTLA